MTAADSDTPTKELHVPTIDVGALLAAKDDAEVEATLQDPNGPFRDTIEALRAAASEWGFFYIVNHGISPETIAELRQATRDFFALPKDVKNTIRRSRDNARGYYDSELTKNKFDWKEVFDIGGPHDDLPPSENVYVRVIENNENRWLSEQTLPGFKAKLRDYFERTEHLSRRLLQLFAVVLGQPVNFFDQFFNDADGVLIGNEKQRVYRNSSALRLNHYPVAPEPEKTMGVYNHTDGGALTVLLQDDDVASLQVFHRGTQKWYSVPPLKDSFTINIGDMVQIWSNDKFLAPPHRVLSSATQSRISIPYFHNPSFGTIVEPLIVGENEKPRYRPLNWFEYVQQKIRGNIDNIGEDLQISQYRIHDPEDPFVLPPIPN